MEFTNSEINAIICEIFGCNDHPLPEEEVSLSEIYADVDRFVEVDGLPWREWVWLPTMRRQSTLSDYNLDQMFAGQPRAEWCRSNSIASSSSTLSSYGLGNMFEDVPRCQWQSRSILRRGSSISDPDMHPFFAFIDPVTWPDMRKRSKKLGLVFFSLRLTPGRSEASTISDYGLEKLFVPNDHYDGDETLSSYNLALLFNDDNNDDEEKETLSCYCLELLFNEE